MRRGSGITRRVFVGRSLTAAAGIMVLANARALPSLAGEAEEGAIERMGRIAFDPEAKKTWVSLLHADVYTNRLETEFGRTLVSKAIDRVAVIPGGLGPQSVPVDVSMGMPHAKLDPRIAARGGRVGVTWCGMDLETRQWSVYASIFKDMPGMPAVVAGGVRPALHPEIALDPHSGLAYVVFEDWADGSIRISIFDGAKWGVPIKVSEGGINYRPRVIITRHDGKNKGSLAVSWDSYRGRQYDVFMKMISAHGESGPEHRVSSSAEWDNESCLAEDRDGNIWVGWIRASTELSNYDRLRSVHARFFNGEKWCWPAPPEGMTGNGRLTGRATTMKPTILVDDANRVHILYRDLEGTMWGVLYIITYEGDYWTGPRKVHDKKIQDALNMIWDYSAALGDRNRVLTIWDSLYVKRLGFAAAVHPAFPLPLPPKPATPCITRGVEGYDQGGAAWPARKRPEPVSMELGGKTCSLLYGDTHSHSWTSDGIDPADWYFHYARDVVGLDYFALSDHDFTICNTPGLEAYISFLPKAFNRPEFICFQAYEFSSQKTGHRVVVFEGDDKPTFSYTWPPKQKSATNDELYPFLRRFALTPDSRVLVTAHNMVQLGNNFTGLDLKIEPLYDVTSLWALADKPFRERKGESGAGNGGIWVVIGKILDLGKTPEQKRLWNMCWRDCLDDGLMLGAYGSSDTHAANGIGFVVSGIWVEKKDRKHIFDAMFARRSLAVDSAIRLADCDIFRKAKFIRKNEDMLRPDLRFFLDGHFMGSSVSLSTAPVAAVFASGVNPADPVRAVIIVKDGKDVATFFGENHNRVEAEWKDDGDINGRHYYYARLEFISGKTAFSSPVFVNFQV